MNPWLLLSLLSILPVRAEASKDLHIPADAVYVPTGDPFEPYQIWDGCPEGFTPYVTDWPNPGSRACRDVKGKDFQPGDLDAHRLKKLCRFSPSFCEDVKAINADIQVLEEKYKDADRGVPPGELESVNARLGRLRNELGIVYGLLPASGRKEGEAAVRAGFDVPVRRARKLGEASVQKAMGSIRMRLDATDDALLEIERGIARHKGRPRGDVQARLAARLMEINKKTGALWTEIRDTGLNIDYLGPKSYSAEKPDGSKVFPKTGAADLTAAMNRLQEDYVETERRIKEADKSLGTGLSPPRDGVKEVAGRSKKNLKNKLVNPFGGDVIVLEPMVITAEAPEKDPDEARMVPGMEIRGNPDDLPMKPPQRLRIAPVAEPVLTPDEPVKKRGPPPNPDMYPLDSAAIKVRRFFGATETVGDPEGREKYTFHQRGGTCGIASQVMMIAERDKLPADPRSLSKMEDDLFVEAVNRGFFVGDPKKTGLRAAGGTPWQYMGDLLDQPMKKHVGASPEELAAAAKTGKMILANANTGHLWNNPEFADGGHIFVITGTEVDKKTGEVLGYYINDTGTNAAGRLVSARQMHEAFEARGGYFVEPLE